MPVFLRAFTFLLTLIQLAFPFLGGKTMQTLCIDPFTKYQTMEGFGTSSAWWAQTIDEATLADEIARLLYDPDTGLGLDVFRYNVGGGEKENPDSVVAIENRKAESFYVYNEASGAWEFDFSRDANARRVLDLAVRYGAKRVVLFANSPHYSMTVNGRASGNSEEGVCNLPPEKYDEFVDYMLTVADHFTELGYPVYAVSPINEPQWNWGSGWVSQEGCHYSPEEAVRLLRRFAQVMLERKTPYKLACPESGQMSEDYAEYERLVLTDPLIRQVSDGYSGHAYWMDGDETGKAAANDRLRNNYGSPVKYEMSEWCELPQQLDPDTIDSGLRMAGVMLEDLTLLNAVSWQSWTAVNGDGLMELRDGAPHLFKRYYCMKQFSAFIPAGAVRLRVADSAKGETALRYAAFDCGDETVFILLNSDETERTVRLRAPCAAMTVTRTSAEENCSVVYQGAPHLTQTLPAKSLTTVRMIKTAN